MSNRHELGNMIFNLENRKNLKEVNFTKDAVREVLGYLKELYEIKNQKHEEDRRVADLEAKLAESEKKNFEILCENEELTYDYADKVAEITKLEQQLAEKETDLSLTINEIDVLKHNLKVAQEHDKVMCESYFNTCNEAHQEKIEFAIAELEKVKRYVEFKRQIDFDPYDAHFHCEYLDAMALQFHIDNQIKQLKEKK